MCDFAFSAPMATAGRSLRVVDASLVASIVQTPQSDRQVCHVISL